MIVISHVSVYVIIISIIIENIYDFIYTNII